jgi:hypothetical protein
MSLLLFSGLLYLLGVSVILVLKPELMFSKEGNWKEFGIGRNKDKYTWMPFWLFSIIWAIVSYMLVLVISSMFGFVDKKTDVSVSIESIEPNNISSKSVISVGKSKLNMNSNEMKQGYYILDTNETVKKGIPKYIYLGPQAPNLIYNNPSQSELD